LIFRNPEPPSHPGFAQIFNVPGINFKKFHEAALYYIKYFDIFAYNMNFMLPSFLGDTTSKNAVVKREILRLCIAHNNYSIADFSRALGISVPTITKLISELRTRARSAPREAAGRASTDSIRRRAISWAWT